MFNAYEVLRIDYIYEKVNTVKENFVSEDECQFIQTLALYGDEFLEKALQDHDVISPRHPNITEDIDRWAGHWSNIRNLAAHVDELNNYLRSLVFARSLARENILTKDGIERGEFRALLVLAQTLNEAAKDWGGEYLAFKTMKSYPVFMRLHIR